MAMATKAQSATSNLKTAAASNGDNAVTAGDQTKINKFARLHVKLDEIKDEIKKKTNDLQNLNDASDELYMVDDESEIPVRIGDCFVHFDSDSIQDKVDELKQTLEDGLTELRKQQTEIDKQLGLLKADLYAKFGDAINLESEERS